MAIASSAQRLLLAGGFALALAAGPAAVALTAAPATPAGPLLAEPSCPTNEVLDTASGACKPVTDQAPATQSPIDPEKNPLETGGITSSREGNIGSLPEINGIPCSGANHGGSSTGQCIGLEQSQGAAIQEPHSSINGEKLGPS